MISTATAKHYSIDIIRQEATALVQMGAIALNQPIRILFEYLPARQWNFVESELELHDYLLRDRVVDLVGDIKWNSD